MFHLVTLYFAKRDAVRFKIMADTPSGALISALAFDWTHADRAAFLGARVDPYKPGDVI
jgi:hypothetical protein